MSYGIGAKVGVIEAKFLGRWIWPFERGIVENRHCSPAGQEVYDVKLQDGEVYVFAPGEIEEVGEAP